MPYGPCERCQDRGLECTAYQTGERAYLAVGCRTCSQQRKTCSLPGESDVQRRERASWMRRHFAAFGGFSAQALDENREEYGNPGAHDTVAPAGVGFFGSIPIPRMGGSYAQHLPRERRPFVEGLILQTRIHNALIRRYNEFFLSVCAEEMALIDDDEEWVSRQEREFDEDDEVAGPLFHSDGSAAEVVSDREEGSSKKKRVVRKRAVDVADDGEMASAAKKRRVAEESEEEAVGKGKRRQAGNRKVEPKSAEFVGTETEEGGEEEKEVDDDEEVVVGGNEEAEDGEISEEK